MSTAVLPGLNRPDYFDPALFPQLSTVAAQVGTYLREYQALMAADEIGEPYGDHPDGAPLDRWARAQPFAPLGAPRRADPRRRHLSETMAAWTTLPVADVPARAPHPVFSIGPGAGGADRGRVASRAHARRAGRAARAHGSGGGTDWRQDGRAAG
ncbi:hypothetical protein [uncultured Sphingomonas sp.]|uniref:hypothetical protein n=1 Tax=uncultured Sphingomonas sp. TaxID=158754 RepID=UPI0035CBF56C